MKAKSLVSICAACFALLMAADTQVCFGQGASTPNCQGIWEGVLISTGSAGSAMLQADLTQNSTALSGVARVSQGVTFHSGNLTGSVGASGTVGFTINLGTFGNLSAALTVNGAVASGTYTRTLLNGSAADRGTVAINLQPGLATANVSGVYIANALSNTSGVKMTGSAVFLLQSGNNLYVSTLWNGTYVINGVGTIIGNSITFELTQEGSTDGAPILMSGMASVNGTSISGVAVFGPATDPSEAAVAFSAEFAAPL